jgi:hypothetical protein
VTAGGDIGLINSIGCYAAAVCIIKSMSNLFSFGQSRLGVAMLFLVVLVSGCASQAPATEVASTAVVVEDDANGALGVAQELEPAAAEIDNAQVDGLPVQSAEDTAAAGSSEQAETQMQQPQVDEGDVIWIQQRLKDLGYYEGPVDGSVGNATRGAVREYQRDQDVNADGQPTLELREFMWRNGG